jgi:hypothetical protein
MLIVLIGQCRCLVGHGRWRANGPFHVIWNLTDDQVMVARNGLFLATAFSPRYNECIAERWD